MVEDSWTLLTLFQLKFNGIPIDVINCSRPPSKRELLGINIPIYNLFGFLANCMLIGCQKSLAVFLLTFQLFIKLVTIMRLKSNMRRFVR